jgi:hypothetical protein
MSQIFSLPRSGFALPSRRYRTALSRREVLLTPPLDLVVSALLEVDLELALEEGFGVGLGGDARAAAVDPALEREPLIVAAIDKSDVLPARWANLHHQTIGPLICHLFFVYHRNIMLLPCIEGIVLPHGRGYQEVITHRAVSCGTTGKQKRSSLSMEHF